MSFVLAGALEGFGGGLMEAAKQQRAEALEKLRTDESLRAYRAKKGIDAEFKRRSGSGSGGDGINDDGTPKMGKPKSLPDGLSEELTAFWNSNGISEEAQADLMLTAEKVYGGGTKGTVRKFFLNTDYLERGAETTRVEQPGRIRGFFGAEPETITEPGAFTGNMNFTGNSKSQSVAPAVTGFSPKPANPVTPSVPAEPNLTQLGPAIGTVVDGYEFKGGNPNDPTSWAEIVKRGDRRN